MNTPTPKHTPYTYTPRISRRDSLKWLSVLSASALVPASLAACAPKDEITVTAKGHWPDLKILEVAAKGYGQDPNLVDPNRAAWPRTLTPAQLTLVAVLSDILAPEDENTPSASTLGVPDVIDEWVSAPYKQQKNDRVEILSTLSWIDTESQLRFKHNFVELSQSQQLEIIDNIAYQKHGLAEEFTRIADSFDKLRRLVFGAFYCNPEASKDLGYLGNVPIMGDYPGPTPEAMTHLNKILKDLNLSL